MTLAFHPYANLFPLIEGQEFYDLAEDIRANGLSEQIMLLRVGGSWQILDGRNRYRALVWLVSTGEVLGEPWGYDGEPLSGDDLIDCENSLFFKHFEAEFDGEPLAYVLSKNLRRRHLDESQRAMVAAKLANLSEGRPSKTAPIGAVSDAAAAAMLNVGERSVERAKAVQREAVPEIAHAVERGQIAVSAAAEIAAQPAERQAEILAALPRDETGKLTDEVKKALAPIVKELRREKVDAKKERRAEREAELGRKIQAMPDQRFGVAIEDFEWDHEAWSRETGLERSPSMHYETAADAHSPEEIVARCAERFKCLAEDCILFKWTTIPHLAIAIHVLELQGFRYVTHLVWDKRRMGEARGTGYWFTGEHEIVLVGVRGKVVAPAVAHFRSVFTEPVGAHSEKPENLHRIIEFHWPNVPKVEFNARRARTGWFAWGFDAPAEASAPEPPAHLEISEYEALKAIGDFCHPRRAEICAAVGADYAAKGFAVIQGGTNAWILREAGRARLNELEAERRASAPPAPAKVERDPLEIPAFLLRKRPQLELGLVVPAKVDMIDDHVQTRLPVNDVEISEAIAMRAIEAGEEIDSEIARHLIGKFWLHCPSQGKMRLTEEGRAALASFVDVPTPAPATEARA